ncbi:hypothetical protein D9M72_593230 [compost metagenome]
MLNLIDELFELAFLFDHQLTVSDRQFRPCIEHAGEDNLLGPCSNIDKTASARRYMRTE